MCFRLEFHIVKDSSPLLYAPEPNTKLVPKCYSSSSVRDNDKISKDTDLKTAVKSLDCFFCQTKPFISTLSREAMNYVKNNSKYKAVARNHLCDKRSAALKLKDFQSHISRGLTVQSTISKAKRVQLYLA